jgi:hypothetical protein
MLAPVVLSWRTQGSTPLSVRATAAKVATGTDDAHFAASASKSADDSGAANAGAACMPKAQAVKAAKREICRCSHGMVFMEHLQLQRTSQRKAVHRGSAFNLGLSSRHIFIRMWKKYRESYLSK